MDQFKLFKQTLIEHLEKGFKKYNKKDINTLTRVEERLFHDINQVKLCHGIDELWAILDRLDPKTNTQVKEMRFTQFKIYCYDELKKLLCSLGETLLTEEYEKIDTWEKLLKKLLKVAEGYTTNEITKQQLRSLKSNQQQSINANSIPSKNKPLIEKIAQLYNVALNHDYYDGHALSPDLLAQQTIRVVDYYHENGLPQAIIKKIHSFAIVYTEGYKFNNYQHVLLQLNDKNNHPIGYLHIDRIFGSPAFLTHQEFKQYLLDWKTSVTAIQQCNTPNLSGARTKIQQLVPESWLWMGPYNNCFTFCAEILKAGGMQHKELDTPLNFPIEKLKKANPQSLQMPNNKPQNFAHIVKHKYQLTSRKLDDIMCDLKQIHNPTYQKQHVIELAAYFIKNLHIVREHQNSLYNDTVAANKAILKFFKYILVDLIVKWNINFGGQKCKLVHKKNGKVYRQEIVIFPKTVDDALKFISKYLKDENFVANDPVVHVINLFDNAVKNKTFARSKSTHDRYRFFALAGNNLNTNPKMNTLVDDTRFAQSLLQR